MGDNAMKTIIVVVAFAADGLILATYARVATGLSAVRAFHWANAVGCIPIIGSEIIVGAWPALMLTAAFGMIGAIGLVTENAR